MLKKLRAWITTHTVVQVKSYRLMCREPEGGYLEPRETFYNLFKLHRKLIGCIPLPSVEVFREQIPTGCYIALACTGYTSWQNSTPAWINAALKEKEWLSIRNFTNKYFLRNVIKHS